MESVRQSWSPKVSLSLVLAADGYPSLPRIWGPISGTEKVSNCAVFHAGTRKEGNEYYVRSGRVLNIATAAENVGEARSKVYDAAKQISFEGMHYRRDIGKETANAANRVAQP